MTTADRSVVVSVPSTVPLFVSSKTPRPLEEVPGDARRDVGDEKSDEQREHRPTRESRPTIPTHAANIRRRSGLAVIAPTMRTGTWSCAPAAIDACART
jgi:hypothetical protein